MRIPRLIDRKANAASPTVARRQDRRMQLRFLSRPPGKREFIGVATQCLQRNVCALTPMSYYQAHHCRSMSVALLALDAIYALRLSAVAPSALPEVCA